ncbi:MAG: SIMPL domain-containing protein [Microbacterium sp.]|uniref:SIMPL domain-containing protein n=1 Tax=Microbacterium sp. TaxID=51671 RepID=UPI0027168E82|nr:SIMPL domain-containing protein [Microbacterium sp.]MDO8383565.1 SIMPL domain-containing protein [Microbacterium sp.]
MSDVIITVRGEHETRIAPEEGVVHLSVRCDGPERGPVVERIAAIAAPLREELATRQASGEVREWSSQRASVWAERPWNNEGKQLPLVHHASVEVVATFTDFAALSWWVSAVAEREGVQVGGVAWQLTSATRRAVEAEVAAYAVQTAVSRAGAYANAIGHASVTPLEIADTGLLGRPEADPGPRMMRAMATDASPGLDFQPQDITVTAGVEARFAAR